MIHHQLKISPPFSIVKKGDVTLFVKEKYKELIQHMVFDTESLYKRYKDQVGIKSGRGNYVSIPLKENSTERFIIKDYKHGGLFGRLFGSVFCNRNRPLNDIYLHEIASQKGVPTAEVIAVTKKRVWGLFYRANFISKEISGAVDIAQFLKESSFEDTQRFKKSVIRALVKLIRCMHDAGIYHADLQVKNILIKENPTREFHAYVIDLDKSIILNHLAIHQRIKNLLRLDRSVEKLHWLSGMGYVSLNQNMGLISKIDRVRFFKYYMIYDNALDKDWKKYVRKYQSHHSFRKLWWRVLDISGKKV
jgi:tRNA A-37 threonylcarbamoyl transferase component Bud32